jgi:hypothetical protein
MDHAQLVHEQWTHAALTGMQLFIKRVATDDNIADLPSRLVSSSPILVLRKCDRGMLNFLQEFRMLRHMGAVEIAPVLHDVYRRPTTWEVLQERWQM